VKLDFVKFIFNIPDDRGLLIGRQSSVVDAQIARR
jgi:hypothetical protein